MKLKDKIKEKLNGNRYTRKLLDYDFRTIVFTIVSLIITTGYGVFYAMLGIALKSVWYGMLACYYLMLVGMRAVVVFYHRRKRKRSGKTTETSEEISRAKIYGNCGIIICLLMLPLSITILLIVAKKATFSKSGLMIYVAAVYTVYKIVMAISNLRKSKKSNDMTIRTVRCINLADMFVSILALQTAMFNSFSPDMDWGIMNAITGAIVCLATLITGVFMIINGRQRIVRINYEAHLQEIYKSDTNC